MEKETLVAVVKRSQTGDPTAQEELILEVQQSVYYQCLKFLHHQEDAQDATQDILISMLTKLNTLNQPEAFWGWLNRMTANHCKNLLRKTGELQIPEDEEGNSLLDTYETLDEQMVPDKALDNEETRRMVIEMIDALPAPQRMCVIMYYYNEMSVKDIAAALEVPENTVKSRLNYARKSIKEGAEKYKKQGIKLYGLSPLPFLLYFLLKDADASALGAETCQEMAGIVMTAAERTAAASGATATASSAASSIAEPSGTTAAASAAEATVAKTGLAGAVKGASLTTKIVAGVLSAAVVLGGGGMLLSNTTSSDDRSPAITDGLGHPESDVLETNTEEPGDRSVAEMNTFLLESFNAAEWATYAKLLDYDGDGTEEVLLLSDLNNQCEIHDGAAWLKLQSMIGGDTSGIYVNGNFNYDATERDHIALLRHIESGAIYLLLASVDDECAIQEYEGGYMMDNGFFVCGESIYYSIFPWFPFETPSDPEQFPVYYDARDYRAASSQQKLESVMAHFEIIDVLTEAAPGTGIEEVRQQLENAAN